MNTAIIGTGYVGLVTGACLAELGNNVVCVDIDKSKIEMLTNGRIPIFEPGLQEIVERTSHEGRLSFTTDLQEALQEARLVFIAVNTPAGPSGASDLSALFAVARQIGENINDYKVIINKSTAPVGTVDKIKDIIKATLTERKVNISFSVAANPEFLKEGSAVNDFMKPDRIIIGCDDKKAEGLLRDLYEPFSRTTDRVMKMDIRSAEMTKYAANAMLAARISFMNEMAAICESVGADVSYVQRGIGSDPRIGPKFLFPGVGYGGSCFPKDIRSLINTASEAGVTTEILTAIDLVNNRQKVLLYEKALKHYQKEDFRGLKFAVWGLAYKPNTDDLRDAPSLLLIDMLLSGGADLTVFDPAAMDNARSTLEGKVSFAENQYQCLEEADALFLVTEWGQFRKPDFGEMARIMRCKIIFDGRNQYDPAKLKELGWNYYSIGRNR